MHIMCAQESGYRKASCQQTSSWGRWAGRKTALARVREARAQLSTREVLFPECPFQTLPSRQGDLSGLLSPAQPDYSTKLDSSFFFPLFPLNSFLLPSEGSLRTAEAPAPIAAPPRRAGGGAPALIAAPPRRQGRGPSSVRGSAQAGRGRGVAPQPVQDAVSPSPLTPPRPRQKGM